MLRTLDRFTLLLAACLVLLGAHSSLAQTSLRWKLQQGQVLNYSYELDMKISSGFGNQNIKQTFDGIWRVDSVDAQGVAQITQEFQRVRMNLDAPGGIGFKFDSDSNEQPVGPIGIVMVPALKAVATAKFTMKMTPFGEIRDVQVSPETVNALREIPAAGGLGGAFTKEGLVNMIEQQATLFPQEPIGKGHSWTKKLETQAPPLGKLEQAYEFTYAGTQSVDGNPLERIDFGLTAKISPDPNAPAQVSIKDQNSKGAIYFDNAAGRMSHLEMVQNMGMSVAFQGNNIEQKIVQTTTVRLTPAAK